MKGKKIPTRVLQKTVLLFCGIFFLGCVNHAPPVVDETVVKAASKGHHRFAFEEYQAVDAKGFIKKVDNFTIIFDPSASMTEAYKPSQNCITCHTDYQNPDYSERHAIMYGGQEFAKKNQKKYAMDCNLCHQNFLYSKFQFAKALVNSFNKTIPDLDLIGLLRTFGYPAYDNLNYGLMPKDNKKYLQYNKKNYATALEKILDADGASPLAPTIEQSGKDWYNHKGKIAIIIISDGTDMGKKEIIAAQELKERFGKDICIYTIHIGNDTIGKKIMSQIAMAGQCGVSITGDHLLEKANMDAFVKDIFLAPGLTDSDGDGVTDDKDDCPDTKPGLTVDENGCWHLVLLADILFDFDKYILKPEGIAILDQVVELLNKYPLLDLHISGHTDNFGSMAYNIKLSKRRSQAGINYLKQKGIAPGRLSMSWHSFSIPVATNTTPSGRALNRRLEFKFNKRKRK